MILIPKICIFIKGKILNMGNMKEKSSCSKKIPFPSITFLNISEDKDSVVCIVPTRISLRVICVC